MILNLLLINSRSLNYTCYRETCFSSITVGVFTGGKKEKLEFRSNIFHFGSLPRNGLGLRLGLNHFHFFLRSFVSILSLDTYSFSYILQLYFLFTYLYPHLHLFISYFTA